jgi:hypothetical protein
MYFSTKSYLKSNCYNTAENSEHIKFTVYSPNIAVLLNGRFD